MDAPSSATALPAVTAPAGPARPADAATGAPRRRTPWWLIALIVGVVSTAGAAAFWHYGFKYRFIPRNWGVVEPGRIYRSGQISAGIVRTTLVDHRIGLVIFMSNDKMERPDVAAESRTAEELGIRRINCSLDGDGTGKLSSYVTALTALAEADRAGTPTLVHCQTGAQRTGGVIAFYRVLVQRRPAPEAYRELLQYGHDPRENARLVPYMNAHMKELADALVERGVIDAPPAPLPVIGP